MHGCNQKCMQVLLGIPNEKRTFRKKGMCEEGLLVNWFGLTQEIFKDRLLWWWCEIYFLSSWVTISCLYKSVYLFCNYRLLNHIAEINSSCKSDELWRFLDVVYHSSVPDPGRTLQVPFNNGRDVCTLFLFSLWMKCKLGILLIMTLQHKICGVMNELQLFDRNSLMINTEKTITVFFQSSTLPLHLKIKFFKPNLKVWIFLIN